MKKVDLSQIMKSMNCTEDEARKLFDRATNDPEGFARTQRMVEEMRKPARRKVKSFQTRRLEKQVGRNEPCPCGFGKKFKRCCMTKQAYGSIAHYEPDDDQS